MVKVCLIAIVAIVIGMFLKGSRPELVVPLSLCVVVICGTIIVKEISAITGSIYTLTKNVGLNLGYISILLKMVGITYIAEISKDLCVDAGFNVLGRQIEIISKLTIVSLSFPVIKVLITTILNLF